MGGKTFMTYSTAPEEPITLSIFPTSKLVNAIKVKVEAKDYSGKILNKTMMDFDAEHNTPRDFTFAGTGHLECRAVIIDGNGKELYESVRGVAALKPFAPADLKDNPDSIFGSWIGRTDRMHDEWGMKWDRYMPKNITKTGEAYTMGNTGKPWIVSKIQGINRIGCFTEMPRFISSKPDSSDFARHLPKDWDEYGKWVNWFVRNNKDNIKIYEVWNEPVASNFWAPRDMESLVKLHEVTYKAIKNASPDARVLGPCPYSFLFDHIEEFLKHGGGKWIDDLVIHAYMDNNPDADGFDRKLEKCYKLLQKYNQKGDIYITEIGYHPDHFTEHQRACNLVRTYLLAIDQKVKVVLWYKWWDYSKDLPNNKNAARWAIARFDYSPTPALTAMRNMIALLENGKYQGRIQLGESKRGFNFIKDKNEIRVVYDISEKSSREKSFYEFKSRAKNVKSIDMVGVEKTLTPGKDDVFRIELSNAPVYIVLPVEDAHGKVSK